MIGDNIGEKYDPEKISDVVKKETIVHCTIGFIPIQKLS